MPSTIKMPDKWPIKVYKGDTMPDDSFELVDENNDPITGFTTRMQIKRNALQTVANLELVEGSGWVEEGNKRTFEEIVTTLPAGVYVFDIEVTLSNGKVVTIFADRYVVPQDVSF